MSDTVAGSRLPPSRTPSIRAPMWAPSLTTLAAFWEPSASVTCSGAKSMDMVSLSDTGDGVESRNRTTGGCVAGRICVTLIARGGRYAAVRTFRVIATTQSRLSSVTAVRYREIGADEPQFAYSAAATVGASPPPRTDPI